MQSAIEKDKNNDFESASQFNTKIIRHYLFLNTKKALTDIFDFTDEDFENIKKYVKNFVKCYTENPNGYFLAINDFNVCWAFMVRWDNIKNYLPPVFHPTLEEELDNSLFDMINHYNQNGSPSDYFMNSYSQITTLNANKYLEQYKSNLLCPDYLGLPYYYWMKARTLIFQLEFFVSDTNQNRYEEILFAFRKAFDCGKYTFGYLLGEFLEDAICAEIYLNPKNKIKDKTIENSQDEFSEGYSLNKNAIEYFEFGYATGFFPENAKQTYLFAYNRGKNFWNAFNVNKFANRQRAYEQFEKDMQIEELSIPLYIDDSKKLTLKQIDSLSKNQRKKLSPELERYYSFLSIAIMNIDAFYNVAEEQYLTVLLDTIKAMNKTELTIFDENGATPLIRALYEYKKCVFGFSSAFSQKRAELLTEVNIEYNKVFELPNSKNEDIHEQKILDNQNKEIEHIFDKLLNDYRGLLNDYKIDASKLQKKQQILKDIILELVNKYDEQSLLAEAIQLGCNNNVSALQLAIESYDVQIVEKIVSTVKKHKFSELYISNEYVSSLQFAIRYYDLFCRTFSKENENTPFIAEQKELPTKRFTSAGVYNENRSFNQNKKTPNARISLIKYDKFGLFNSKNDFEGKSKNLQQIIKLLADKFDTISVDTMYYLADAECFNDILDLAKYILETKKVDIAGTNYEFDRSFLPQETILARCIRQYNFGLCELILTNEDCKKKLRPVINQLVTNYNEEKTKIVSSTDTDYFFANVVNKLRYFQNKNEQNTKDYQNFVQSVHDMLLLFHNAGARFDIKDQLGFTTFDYIEKRKKEGLLPEDIIPKEIYEE